MLQVNNVSLQYGSKKLFEEVNLRFTRGNCYGIIGANTDLTAEGISFFADGQVSMNITKYDLWEE